MIRGYPRKNGKEYIPGESAYKRVFSSYHYKKKLLDFDLFMKLVKEDCYYCGSPPRLIHAYGPNGMKFITSLSVFNDGYIYMNGIDKKIHQENYSDPNNLVTCCKICNYMKQRIPHDEFIMYCNNIANKHKIIP